MAVAIAHYYFYSVMDTVASLLKDCNDLRMFMKM